jgi:hypothetical protein
LGEPDESKFKIVLPTRKTNSKGGVIQGQPAVYKYPNKDGFEDPAGRTLIPFDWDNFKHIKALHQWREQVFRRRIGGRRSTRKPWLELEKAYLLEMLEDHMKRHSRPQFNKLANAFNRHFHGTIQPKGQRYVFPGKKNDGGLLDEDRAAPWRTASALSGQTYKWPEFAELLKKREAELAAATSADDDKDAMSSADEVEYLDPTPPQTDFGPRDYKQWKCYKAKHNADEPSDTTNTGTIMTEAKSSSTKTKTLSIKIKTASSAKTSKQAKNSATDRKGKRKYVEESSDDDEESDYKQKSDSSSDALTIPDYDYRGAAIQRR